MPCELEPPMFLARRPRKKVPEQRGISGPCCAGGRAIARLSGRSIWQRGGGKVGGGAKSTAGKRAKPRKAPARKKSPRKRGKSRQLASSGGLPPRFYRIIEILIGGGLAAAASLAVLARLAGSVSPLALLASLAGVTVLGTIVVLLLEKIRHRASGRWRSAVFPCEGRVRPPLPLPPSSSLEEKNECESDFFFLV